MLLQDSELYQENHMQLREQEATSKTLAIGKRCERNEAKKC